MSRTTILLLTALSAMLGVAGTGHAAATDGRGWTLTILGATDGMTTQAFEEAVIATLPTALLDPETNFTRSAAYRRDSHYRLILVFSGAAVDHADLCQALAPGQESAVAPHRFGDLAASTRITAVFCRDDISLNAADDRLSGSVQPGSRSFAFLVSDVLKRLFPDGYAVLPRPRH